MPDFVIPDWAYRLLFVTYPKAAVFLALGKYILGSLRTVPPPVSFLRAKTRVMLN